MADQTSSTGATSATDSVTQSSTEEATTTTTTTTSTTSTSSTTSTTTTSSSESTTSTETSTSSSSSSTTTSSTSSTSTSSETSSSATSTSATSTSATSTSLAESSSGPVITSTRTITPSSSSTAGADTRNSSNGFFDNTGAVAGTFTAVGIVVVVIIVVLATRYIRRRRAKKFDEEIDEAAAAAAAVGTQPQDFDDYDYRSGTTTNFGGYSEASHGTLAQPALVPQDYPLADVPNYGGDPYSLAGVGAGAGAAGIGAGIGAGAQRARSQRNGSQPYNAFAREPRENYEMHDTNNLRYRRSTAGQYDIVDPVGLTAEDPYAIARHQSQRSQPNASLSRNLSSNSGTGGADSQSSGPPAYSGQSHQPFSVPPGAYYNPPPQQPPAALQPGHSPPQEHDPYGGYEDQQRSELPNPHSASTSQAQLMPHASTEEDHEGEHLSYVVDHHNGSRESVGEDDEDDEDDHGGRRVLRVANE